MSIWGLPVRRPVATAMFFTALVMLGLAAWQRIAVELLPPVSGDRLYASFFRPGSDPDLIEREILLPLEARIGELPDVVETWGEISGSSGTFTVRFEPGADLQVRELDLRRLAAELAREQPQGSAIDVSSRDLTTMSRFVMFIQVTGMDDRNSLLDLVEQRIIPRLAAVPGVSRAFAGGGAPREVTVEVDTERAAAMGVDPSRVTAVLAGAVQRLRYLGGAEDGTQRTAVVLDGRPRGVRSLAETRISPQGAVLLRHVADVRMGVGREETLFRVNGRPTVALIMFQDEGANLVRLGREVRARLQTLRGEFAPYGLEFVINFDASEMVQDQLDRLKRLALSGFVIALAVLFLFLRQWRAVAVVAVAVPTSLLSALALLLLAGQSLNLITLFGLAVGIGMLVDNSIVVYEAVQRQLERGAGPDRAAERGVARTVRAILAASLTNAVVFVPIAFAQVQAGGLDTMTRSLLRVLALAILLPMAGSVLVAVGLVPLLARRLAAPAAVARLAKIRRRRDALGGLSPPDRARELFSGLLKVALRRPGGWVSGVFAAVMITVIVALPWVAFGALSQEASEADSIRMSVDIAGGASLERAAGVFTRLEEAAQVLEGVKHVESMVREDGGTLTVHLLPKDERPEELSAGTVREAVRRAAEELSNVELDTLQMAGGGGGGGGGDPGGGGGLFGQSPSTVVISGPEARQLEELALEIEAQLESIPEVQSASVGRRTGQDEIHVRPDARAMEALGLTADQVLPSLSVVRREGVALRTGFTLRDGREIPLTVRRKGRDMRATEDLKRLRLATSAGVVPLGAMAEVHRMPAPPIIRHHNGRREQRVTYVLGSDAPSTGPARQQLETRIREAVQRVHRPAGYAVEAPDPGEQFNWFRSLLLPALLLLFAVLAIAFESMTLPLLVLISLPLTVLGATWALVLTGTPADWMALVGALALVGLTVNPAILLVDRMQQHAHQGGMGAGASALAAVRERVRPVMMTTTTTVAGLWPLALVTGRENELWPPFATVVMGGLITSTMLTLLVVPVGFVFLNRLDGIFGRLGPWIVLGWAAATAAVVGPLVYADVLTSMTWQVLTTLLVAAVLLAVSVWIFRRPERPEPEGGDGPPPLEVRFLKKIYGRPGPIGRAWRLPEEFGRRVLERGGRPFDPRAAAESLPARLLLFAAGVYLSFTVQSTFWRLLFLLAASGVLGGAFRELRRARGRADEMGRVDPGGVEGGLAYLAPWMALAYVTTAWVAIPWLEERPTTLAWWGLLPVLAGLIALVQLGRRTAVLVSRGLRVERLTEGRLRYPRSLWRRLSRRLFGLDLPREEVLALSGVHFRVRRGMVGVLGPNGAGKTTLLRQLAGILEPSVGRIDLGGVPLKRLRRYLARYVGYLPQDFGLPENLSAREYLDYYALLYELGSASERAERVAGLLREVGLEARCDERIGGYSGGMRQRVAVARTLLRLPPLIIVDEPTVGLDPRERIRFRNLLSRLSDGRVVLFSTHVVEDVAVACERVLVLSRGRLVFDGPPDGLADRAKGKVWEVRIPASEAVELPRGAMLVDQAPEGDGSTRNRVLADDSPHTNARAVAPNLQDGYLLLVGEAPSP